VIPGELYSVVGSASHDFGWARLYGTLLGQRDSSSDQKSRGFELGAGIPVHTGTVAISYGVGFKSKLNGDDQQRAVAAAAAYFYPFSKRTRAYVGDQYQKIARSGSGNAIVVGMTHSF
jgi:predicted porin